MILIKLLIGIISISLIALILYIIGRTTIHITDPETKNPPIADCLLASILGVMLIVGAIAVCGILTVIGHVVLEHMF
jgi:amino acid transporter